MDKKTNYIVILKEFLRYVLVGGIAFLADAGTLYLSKEFVFNGGSDFDLFFSTASGFVVGLIVNYLLSVIFVFRHKDNKSDGKSVSSFIIFTVIGLIGLGLTELGMYTFVYVLGVYYIVSKIFVAGVVLVWNYVGRKIFVFGRETGKGKK